MLKQEDSIHLKEKFGGNVSLGALVCNMLQRVRPWNVRSTLKEFQRGLDSIYGRMMGQILGLEDSDVKICKCILISAILALQPLHLKEPGVIADFPKELPEDSSLLEEQVQLCGSFLTIREDTVYLVHQSAKDLFTNGNGSSIISLNHQAEHGKIAYRPLDLMSNTLWEDMCDLQKPGTFVAQAHKKFGRSRFAHIEYACFYWVDHLAAHLTDDKHNQSSFFDHGGKVQVFLQKHLLYWLEVLGLLGKVSDSVLMLNRLQSLIDVSLLIRCDYSSRYRMATLSFIQTKIYMH